MAETIIHGGYANSKAQIDALARTVRLATGRTECVHGETAVDATRHPGRAFERVHEGPLTLVGYSQGGVKIVKSLQTIQSHMEELDQVLDEIIYVGMSRPGPTHHLIEGGLRTGFNFLRNQADDPEERLSYRQHGKSMLGEIALHLFSHAGAIRELSQFDTIEEHRRMMDTLQISTTVVIMTKDEIFPPDERTLYAAEAAGMRIVEVDGYHSHFVKHPVETLGAANYKPLLANVAMSNMVTM